MKETNIRLVRNLEWNDWSVQIDGKLYDHISTDTLDDLLEYTSLAAQQGLLEVTAVIGGGRARRPSPTVLAS